MMCFDWVDYLRLSRQRAKFFKFDGQSMSKRTFSPKFFLKKFFRLFKALVVTIRIVHQLAEHFLDSGFGKQNNLLG